MSFSARFLAAAVLCGATLVFTGCVTNKSARTPRVERLADFAVVESSTAKPLTPAQLAEIKRGATHYLQEQGLAGERMYFVKVTFASADPLADPEWAIVRIGNLPAQTYTVLAAYPGADDYYPQDYYRYGYYDRYGPFTRVGYSYDPFDSYHNYGGGYYGPTRPPRHPHNPTQPTQPGKPDDQPVSKPDRPRTPPPPGLKPSYPGDRDRWTRNRDDGNSSRPVPTSSSAGNSYTPPPAPSYSPPPAYNPPPPPPVRSEPTPQVSPAVRDESSRFAPQPNEK